jgi:hypothetical protein
MLTSQEEILIRDFRKMHPEDRLLAMDFMAVRAAKNRDIRTSLRLVGRPDPMSPGALSGRSNKV